MRKFVLALVILLLAAPAWAAQEVECEVLDVPGPNTVVAVNYNIDDGNDIRAFGIRIDVNNGATISNIDVNDKDYYIFPGSIDINDTTGEVDSNGIAVAEGGEGESYMILEMGSLYAADDPVHKTKPLSSGLLCTFEVSKECVVSLSEDTERGGIVLEDITKSFSGTPQGCTVSYFGCLPQVHADWTEWDSVDRPTCWCYYSQCYGDADGIIDGGLKAGGYYHVGSADLTILGGSWRKKYMSRSEPNCVNYTCADFDHGEDGGAKVGGYYRVGSADLTVLGANWRKKCSDTGSSDPNCGKEDCGGTLGEKFTDYGI